MILVGNVTVESWTQSSSHGRSQPYAYHSIKFWSMVTLGCRYWKKPIDRIMVPSSAGFLNPVYLLARCIAAVVKLEVKSEIKSWGTTKLLENVRWTWFPNYPRSPRSCTIHYFTRTEWRRIRLEEVEEGWNSSLSTNTYLGTSWVLVKRLKAVKLEWHCLSLEIGLIMKQLH